MSSSGGERPDGDAAPALSIVVPTCRRPALLRRTLDRLEGQRDAAIEVIVVDDARDDPRAVAAAVDAAGRPYRVATPDRQVPGVAGARNVGWRAATAPLILFLGDDILADPGLVDAHLAAHRRWPQRSVAVLGHVRWADELRVTPFMRFLEEGVQFDYAHMQAGDVGWGRFYCANVSLKRDLLVAAGGFDDAFAYPCEDIELGRRLADHDLRLMYDPSITVEHVHPSVLADWERRMAAVAPAERAMAAKHPDFTPWFHNVLLGWRGQRPPRLGALVDVVPARVPVLGPRVHAAARARWKIALADAYHAAWDATA